MAARRRSSFGQVRKLPSGRFQGRYRIPGSDKWVNAPTTFETKGDAETWLSTVRADMARGAWTPVAPATTFGEYAETWLAHRRIKGRPLAARTKADYRKLLDRLIYPGFERAQVRRITPDMVRNWYGTLDAENPTLNAHAYSLLKTILATAVDDDLLSRNPCRIRGAGQSRRASKTEPATLPELTALVEAMPQRYRLMVLLAAWCGLRFGELTELRGKDVDTRNGLINVRRGVTWPDGVALVGDPKTEAGKRDVALPPHLLTAVREHILSSGAGKDGLLFPAAAGGHMRPSTLYRVYYPAREAAGRPDLRFHDLRHTGATLAAATGATIAELMARLGHSTPSAAMRYQHAPRGRDAEIARKLSLLVEVDS